MHNYIVLAANNDTNKNITVKIVLNCTITSECKQSWVACSGRSNFHPSWRQSISSFTGPPERIICFGWLGGLPIPTNFAKIPTTVYDYKSILLQCLYGCIDSKRIHNSSHNVYSIIYILNTLLFHCKKLNLHCVTITSSKKKNFTREGVGKEHF